MAAARHGLALCDGLDQGTRLLFGELLPVRVSRVLLRHANDLVLIATTHLEAARTAQALQLTHRAVLPLIPVGIHPDTDLGLAVKELSEEFLDLR